MNYTEQSSNEQSRREELRDIPEYPDFTESIAPSAAEVALENQRIESAKNNALVSYVLMTIGIFTGIFWFIGAIWAMVKKEDAINTPYYDHYTNIVKTFWWGLLWAVIGFVTWMFFIGGFIVLIAGIWSIYRIIKGLARTTSNKPYDD